MFDAPAPTTLSDEQSRAVMAARDWYAEVAGVRGANAPPPAFRLAGYAGTGKSTIIPYLVEALGLEPQRDVVYVAPTGKAALVMSRKLAAAGVAVGATTIHKAIYKPPIERRGEGDSAERWLDKQLAGRAGLLFELAGNSPVRHAKLVIVDEASMVGRDLGTDLASFGIPLLAIGDPGQLPPVEDDPAFDMAEVERAGAPGTPHSAFLSEIHRQARDNPIIRLAHEVRAGGYPRHGVYGEGVRVVKPGTVDIPTSADAMPAVIVGTHKRRWQLTAAIRESLGFSGPLPRSGERVICCKNSRLLPELVNGAEGVALHDAEYAADDLFSVIAHVADIDGNAFRSPAEPGEDAISAPAPLRFYRGLFDEHAERRRGAVDGPRHLAVYRSKELEHLDFGWAITAHKSQGSSWSNVLVIDESHVFRGEWKRWLYTSITRAEDRLTIVTG